MRLDKLHHPPARPPLSAGAGDMLEALSIGIKGHVGSQFNFAGDVYNAIRLAASEERRTPVPLSLSLSLPHRLSSVRAVLQASPPSRRRTSGLAGPRGEADRRVARQLAPGVNGAKYFMNLAGVRWATRGCPACPSSLRPRTSSRRRSVTSVAPSWTRRPRPQASRSARPPAVEPLRTRPVLASSAAAAGWACESGAVAPGAHAIASPGFNLKRSVAISAAPRSEVARKSNNHEPGRGTTCGTAALQVQLSEIQWRVCVSLSNSVVTTRRDDSESRECVRYSQRPRWLG